MTNRNEAWFGRVLVTGGNGMVGRCMPWGVKLTRSDLEMTDFGRFQDVLQCYEPTGVVHLAAMGVRQSEENPHLACNTNALASYHLARLAREHSIPFLFLSTGAVFNGDLDARFGERDIPDPQQIYGQSKFVAERLIQECNPDALIVRTGWLFGGSAKKFVSNAIELAQSDGTIVASDDQVGSPTSVVDLVSALENLLASEERGIVHVVNDGCATAADIARYIVKALGSRSTIDVRPSAEIGGEAITRSRSEALVSSRVQLRSWQHAINESLDATATPERD